jgi:hypothetical protein
MSGMEVSKNTNENKLIMKSLTYQFKYPSLILFMILSVVPSLRAIEKIHSEVEKDGLILEVFYDPNQSDENPKVECHLTNKNEYQVPYEIVGVNKGFVFDLLDADGRIIKKNNRWEIAHSSDYGFRRIAWKLEPKEKTTYILELRKAFEDRWKEGVELKVYWDPGFGGRGKVNTIGKNTQLSIPLKPRSEAQKPAFNEEAIDKPTPEIIAPLKLKENLEREAELKVAEASEKPSSKPKQAKKPESSPSSATNSEDLKSTNTPWLPILVLIFVATGGLWFSLKRRSKK